MFVATAEPLPAGSMAIALTVVVALILKATVYFVPLTALGTMPFVV